MRFLARCITTVLTLGLLTACGGGGGFGGVVVIPTAEFADPDEALVIVQAAADGPADVADDVDDLFSQLENFADISAVDCSNAPAGSVTVQRINANTVEILFTNCEDPSDGFYTFPGTLDGSIRAVLLIDDLPTDEQIRLIFAAFTITGAPPADASIDGDGTLRLQMFSTGVERSTFVVDSIELTIGTYTVRVLAANEQIDFIPTAGVGGQVQLDTSGGVESTDFIGTAKFETLVPIVYDIDTDEIVQGVVLLTGINGSTIRITDTAVANTASVAIDYFGDGSVVDNLTWSWIGDILSAPPTLL